MRPKSSAQASRERERLKDVDTSYSKNRNSFASKDYRDTYRSYLNDNYRNSGFFSDNSSMNSIFWGYIIGDMIGDSFRSSHYNDRFNQLDQKQKELFYNIREGRTKDIALNTLDSNISVNKSMVTINSLPKNYFYSTLDNNSQPKSDQKQVFKYVENAEYDSAYLLSEDGGKFKLSDEDKEYLKERGVR